MRATLEAFIEAAASSVLRSQYEPPRQAPIVFSTIVQFHGSQPLAVVRTAPVMNDLTADGALRVGGAMKTPTKVRDAKPVYPPEAREAGVQGVVIVEARIEPDGHVSAAQILRSIPMLDQAALDAVYQWEFTPTLINGVPTAVVMTVTIQFSLN